MVAVDVTQLPAPIHDLTATALAPTAALSGPDGHIRAEGRQGMFVGDTRVLGRVCLSFADTEPQALAHLPEGPGRTRFIGFAHGFGDRVTDPTVRIDWIRTMEPDGMTEEIRLRCTAAAAV